MNKIFSFFVFFCFIFSVPGFSEEIISSKVKKVTLFTNYALVEKEAKTEVKKGLNNIFIETKAFNIDKDSLSVKIIGKGQIYSVKFKEIYLKEEPEKNIREIEEKIEKLNMEKNQLLDKISLLEKKEEFLNSLINFSKVQIPKDIKTKFPSMDNLEETLSFLDEHLSKIYEEKDEKNRKIKEIEKEIDFLKKKLSSLKVPHKKTKKVIEVLFNSKKDQKINVETSYLVYNCSWQPFYKINVPPDLKEKKITMLSKIIQKTGEDWENVKLSISNAIPLRGVSLPSLNPWFLNIYPERKLQMKKDKLGKVLLYEMIPATSEKEAGMVQAERKVLPLSFEYEFPGLLSIKSKEEETILSLFEKEIKGETFYLSIPKKSNLTYFVLEATPDRELLNGYMNVYFSGRFIGKTYLKEKKAGEKFYLNLGADRNVKVKRIKVQDKVEETFWRRFERKFAIRNLEYKIIIENMKNKPIKIKVIDNIPVSKTDRIEVKDVKFSPEPKEINYQNKEGVELWELKIGKKGKKEINIKFTIVYPRDFYPYGL